MDGREVRKVEGSFAGTTMCSPGRWEEYWEEDMCLSHGGTHACTGSGQLPCTHTSLRDTLLLLSVALIPRRLLLYIVTVNRWSKASSLAFLAPSLRGEGTGERTCDASSRSLSPMLRLCPRTRANTCILWRLKKCCGREALQAICGSGADGCPHTRILTVPSHNVFPALRSLQTVKLFATLQLHSNHDILNWKLDWP